MISLKFLRTKAKAAGGYGLALLMVFIASAVLIGTSFQLVSTPATIAYVGTSSQSNLAARELAMAGMAATETDIRSKLDASQSITTSYRYPTVGSNTIYAPSDPTNLASAGTAIGTYYATVPYARGNTIMVTVTATVGAATTSYSQLMTVSKVTVTPPYDCSVVENQVLAGNIASVASADLIAYAQNNCMIKTASVTMQTPTAGSGSTASCATYSGSGTISFATLGNCATTVNGTYSTIQLNSTASSTASSLMYSYPTSGPRTIYGPGNTGSFSTFRAETSGGTISTYAHTWIFNATNPASAGEFYGSNGDDTFYFNGASTTDLYTRDGFNQVMINGTWGTSDNGSYMRLGETGSTGANYVYINNFTNYPGQGVTLETYSTGVTKLYFNTIGGDDVYIHTGAGADTIACGVSFTGGTGSCSGTFANGTNNGIDAGAGNDIISIDAKIGDGATIQGGTGNNIMYIKGCGGTATATTSIQPGSATSLLIVGGNRAADCWANGSGSPSVILKKSGITEGNSTTGYARTLTY